MSDFEADLIRLVIGHCNGARGDREASTEATHIVTSVLATAIARLIGGHPEGCAALAKVIGDELPGMVAKRAASFREHFGAPEPTGVPQ